MTLVWRTRWLSLQPEVWLEDRVLHARSSTLARVLTLGSYWRDVVVDASTGYVHVDVRYLWALHAIETIPFGHVDHVTYEFSALPTAWDRWGRRNQLERFTVSLVTRRGEKVELCSFRGDGSVGAHPLVFAELAGTQESASRWFVEQLTSLLGVGLGPKLDPIRDEAGKTWCCTACRRPSPPRFGRCLYCGGATAPADAAVDVSSPRGRGHAADGGRGADPAREALERWNRERSERSE